MPTYDLKQQVFCVSMLSNFPSPILGMECDIATQATHDVMDTLQEEGLIELVGEWEVAWGISVFQLATEGNNVSDNAMYVAKSKSGPTRYIIGVAGTNPKSWYAWLIEDFFVSKVVPWPYDSPAGLSPHIAAGTAAGLKHLQEMTPCEGLPGAGQTLLEFLTQAITAEPDGSPVEVITSGHSLGGTLSPTLALWLENIKPEWDPENKSTIITYPAAGATAGDIDFATYSDNTLGERCIRIWNQLDIFPHVWNVEQINQIPGIYEPDIETSPYIERLADLAVLNTNGHPYQQIKVDDAPLPGTYIPQDSHGPFLDFLNQAFYQHFYNYFNLLGVQRFWEYVSGHLDPTNPNRNQLTDIAASMRPEEEVARIKAKLDGLK